MSATVSPEAAQPIFDGTYEMFLQPGTYMLTATEWVGNRGHTSKSATITAIISADLNGIDFQLSESGIPIAEFNAIDRTTLMVIAAAASILAVRRIRKGCTNGRGRGPLRKEGAGLSSSSS